MTFPELLLLGLGLAMDAFAVSICKGLAMDRVTLKRAGVVGLWFGGAQALMPLLGWLLGSAFAAQIQRFDHWIAFVLLAVIGGSMIREALSDRGDESGHGSSLAFGAMFALALATSIDALAVGVTLAFLQVDLLPSVAAIGAVTFLLSALGTKIGNAFGLRYKKKAEIAGGIILILMGLKILLEHLGVL